jgi:cytochrome c
MNIPFGHIFAAAALAALYAPLVHAEGDAAAGKLLYASKCAACHSIDYNGAGPAHKNLFGRRAGSAPGFAYSQALKNSGVVWGPETLARWLTDPEKFVPGQKMFVSVPDARERADIVAYLQLVTGPQPPIPPQKTGEVK